jgi:electron transport complex protein RnfC
MMGYALPDDDVPTTKATNCIIAATSAEVRLDTYEWPCIRCGDCATVCPSRLVPQDLLVAATTSDVPALHTLGLQDCIECGCCDVICPSHIMLTERFRIAKRAIAAHERVQVTAPGQE